MEDKTIAKWMRTGMVLVALLNLGVASVRAASTDISAHQMRTDLFYLGLAILGLAGSLPGLWRRDWRTRGRLWWVVVLTVAAGLAGGLLYVHAWAGGSYVHYDCGLPFPWIKGGAMIEGYRLPETGPVYWGLAWRGLLADLLIWTSVGYALAALVARARQAASGSTPGAANHRRNGWTVGIFLLLLVVLLLAGCGAASESRPQLGASSDVVAGLTVEEYPIVAADVDTPSHFEFLDRIPGDILAHREAWRGFDAVRRVSTLNETLEPFGYRLVAEENAAWHCTFYDLYRRDELLLSDLSHVWPVAVNEKGTDFAFVAENTPNQMPMYLLIRNGDVQALDYGQFLNIPPVYLGDDLLTVESLGDWRFVIKRDGEVVYTYTESEPRADLPVKRLLAWESHWILEVAGKVIVDGESLNDRLDVDEIFHYVIFQGQPLFFFKQRGQVRISYGGETLPLTYDEVVHYRCCEPAVFNIASNEHMLWFYALKDGTWHYVEMGAYDEQPGCRPTVGNGTRPFVPVLRTLCEDVMQRTTS